MNKFNELQKKHEKLLLKQISKEIAKLDVEKFIKEVVSSGGQVSSARERDQLRANLRYWANYVYEETGTYPNIELLPSSTSMVSSALFLTIVFSSIIVIVSFGLKGYGTSLQAVTPTSVVTPTPECSVQPASQFLIDPSVNQTKFIMVLFDKSGSYSQYTKATIDLAKSAILPEIGMEDRLVMAWISSGVAGDTIFFNERVPKAQFPTIPPTPEIVLTPTLGADGTTLQRFEIQSTNVAIDASNQTIIQQVYSCDIGEWNSEFEKNYNEWLPQQTMLENDFRDQAAKALDQNEITSFDKNTEIYDSLYLASRIFNSSIEEREYDDYILIIFSDLVNRNTLPPREYNIDLSEVNVIAAISCESAIECQSLNEFWEQEFLSFGVRNTTVLLFPYEATESKLRDLIITLSNR